MFVPFLDKNYFILKRTQWYHKLYGYLGPQYLFESDIPDDGLGCIPKECQIHGDVFADCETTAYDAAAIA